MTATDLSVEDARQRRSDRRFEWMMRGLKLEAALTVLVLAYMCTDGFFGLVETRAHKEYKVAAESVETEAADLARHHRADELMRRIELFETEDLQPLEPLVSLRRYDREDLLRAAKEHPFVAYALLLKNIDTMVQREETYLAARKARLEEVRRFAH